MSAVDEAELVHEARKTIKRMRAFARLLRDELGEQEFKRVNASLRAAGRRLASARDADVRLATLEQLRERHPKALALDGVERLARRLREERDREAGAPAGGGSAAGTTSGIRSGSENGSGSESGTAASAKGSNAIGASASPRQALEDVAEMRRDLARWNLVDPDFDTLAPGLRRIYREGRRRYARVERDRDRDPDRTHDWRKRVKALYHALDMLGALDAKGVRGIVRRADRIGDLLGEEHDLWMLATYVERHPDALERSGRSDAKLLELIERRRRRLRRRALKQGARLYKHKPGRFVARVRDSLAR